MDVSFPLKLEMLSDKSMEYIACQLWKRLAKAPQHTALWTSEAVTLHWRGDLLLDMLAKWQRRVPGKCIVGI